MTFMQPDAIHRQADPIRLLTEAAQAAGGRSTGAMMRGEEKDAHDWDFLSREIERVIEEHNRRVR